jgi:hypothetical protein
LVGDTGFEPVTSSVSGQNLCLGTRGSGVPGACAGSLMSATVRVGWPTVWPTVKVAALSRCETGCGGAENEHSLCTEQPDDQHPASFPASNATRSAHGQQLRRLGYIDESSCVPHVQHGDRSGRRNSTNGPPSSLTPFCTMPSNRHPGVWTGLVR